MKSIGLSVIRLLSCSVTILTICAGAQEVSRTPSGRNVQLVGTQCITGATIQLTVSPAYITPGQSSVVNWSVTLPAGCVPVNVRLNGQTVAASGSRTVSPYQTSTYTVAIRQTLTQKSASTQLVVDYPESVVINPSTPNPVETLIGALRSSPVKIELCDVELDLTGHSIEIGDDTWLTASPSCARGPRKDGPRIYVTDRRDADHSLFVIRGDRVLFSGFRLEGPTSSMGVGDKTLERGIKISPFECVERVNVDGMKVCTPDPIEKIEISNMEIFHWSGAAIEVTDNNKNPKAERGRLFNTNVGAVSVRNSYIHHNRHGDGYGYGVAVTNGAYALIERNVFDENRHAIMGGKPNGKDASGYTARENLILPGGGKHCSENWFLTLTGLLHIKNSCWQTHQIDQHGNKSYKFGTYGGCCGTAGETIIIERNTILYVAGYAIKIRGNPADRAVVDGNIFTHNSSDEAIDQNGDPKWYQGWHGNITNPVDIRPNNAYKILPLSDVGKCDFVDDGQQDTFAATGVTWWAWSPVTKQWRYLNTMPEPFSKLQVGNVDNDGLCDVAKRTSDPNVPPQTYSKSGTGPWQPVQVVDPITHTIKQDNRKQ